MIYFDCSSFQGCHFTWKPEKIWKNLEFDNLGKKTFTDLEFKKI